MSAAGVIEEILNGKGSNLGSFTAQIESERGFMETFGVTDNTLKAAGVDTSAVAANDPNAGFHASRLAQAANDPNIGR